MTPRAIERAFRSALASLDPRARVRDALGPSPPGGLSARVLAIGKAAPAMAAGALDRWGEVVASTLVITPRGTDVAALAGLDDVKIMRAAHPLPDESSVRAAEAALDFVHTGRARHAILVLVSGGASALVCRPAVSLEAKRAITRAMLASGAPIQEINVLRKHLSRIKGGGLVRAAYPNRVATLIVSDVLGGAPTTIGSGPSVPDPSRRRDARRIVRRYAPELGDVRLVDTLRTDDRRAAFASAAIIVSPEELASAIARELRARGVRARILPPTDAPVEALAQEYAALASRARGRAKLPIAFVRAAEPSVALPRGGAKGRGKGNAKNGRGGRSTHLAALVARALAEDSARPVGAFTFAAFATDGVDGASGTAGAIVTEAFAKRAGIAALSRSIERFDTGTIHRRMRTALAEAPTGHNLADLHVLVVS